MLSGQPFPTVSASTVLPTWANSEIILLCLWSEGESPVMLFTLAASLSFPANHRLLNLSLQAGIHLLVLDPLVSVPIDCTWNIYCNQMSS